MPQPREMVERVTAARSFRAALNASSPMYIDGMNNEAMKAYVAWPERLFVMVDGHLSYVGDFGPEGYDVLELEAYLEGHFNERKTDKEDVASLIRDVVNPAAAH